MKTELAPTSSDLSLLPRADLPVIWDGFAAKAEQLRLTAETLTVTTIEQKAEMELARTTRLTLKQIRVEVEKKRIELGEGHLTEIQKINGAAKKIKEMIEPLEARLLHQEQFAERVEADRVLELTKRRNDEVRAIWPGCPGDFGRMPDAEYDALIARLRAEAALMAEEKRRQAETIAEEKRLRDEQAQAFLAQQAEAQRQARAVAAESELKLAAERAESKRQNEEFLAGLAAERAERRRQEQELIDRLAREQSEKDAARVAKEAEEKKVRDEQEAVLRAELEVEIEKQREEQRALAAKMLELEVQLANERAAKQAEERRLHALAVAPDKEQLKAFHNSIYQVPQPDLKTPEAVAILNRVQCKIAEAFLIIDVFCAE